MSRRYAAYYAPAADDPLWRAGCAWLGRDPTGAEPERPPERPNLAELTADPRGYGFHATLKPPMRLRDGATRDDLLAALHDVASFLPRFALPPLAVTNLDGFLCLRETAPSVALQSLSDAAVAGLDHLRAAPDDAELARRRRHGLSPVREANLRRWGYPDVFATWFFHMTLSRRLKPPVMAAIRPLAEAWFAASLSLSREAGAICLFEQQDGGPFALTARVPLATPAL